jgi:ribonuclease P protein component
LKNSTAIRNTFKAYERLKREQHIDTLFRTGKAYSVLPLRFIHITLPRGEELSPVRIGFTIPKKKFRKAVQRNRIKRLIREAWRLNKHLLYPSVPADKQVHLFIIFMEGKAELDVITEAIVKGIERLKKELITNS